MNIKCNRFKARLAKSLANIPSALIWDKEIRKIKRKDYTSLFSKWLKVQGPIRTAYNNRYIYHGQVGSDLISGFLTKNSPCLIARLGLTEMLTIDRYVKDNNYIKTFHKSALNKISTLSGFFPANNDMVSRFCSESLEVLKQVDVLGCWNRDEEEQLVNAYCPEAKLTMIGTTNPIWFDSPWSQHLQGKKVLVVHPFAELIEEQYQKRTNLFDNPLTLPNFELKTIKAVQSLADNKIDLPYQNWFEALEHMYRQIDQVDFDVALIGAGAYGMFLGAYCKSIGKQAVHMGGVTQLLFGIYGNVHKGVKLNDYWVKPRVEDRPKGYMKVEDGCYW